MRSTITKFLFVFCIFYSCKPNNDEKLLDYLKTLHIQTQSSSITVIDPEFCGSCTMYTINWMNNHRSKNSFKKYYILTTGNIPNNLFKKLNANLFIIKHIDGIRLKRLGYGGAISYNISFDRQKNMSKKIIKKTP